MSTHGGSTVPPILNSSIFHPRIATLTRVSNLMTAFGVRCIFNSVVPPTGTTPKIGSTVRPGKGFGSITCKQLKNNDHFKEQYNYIPIHLCSNTSDKISKHRCNMGDIYSVLNVLLTYLKVGMVEAVVFQHCCPSCSQVEGQLSKHYSTINKWNIGLSKLK